MTAVDRPDNGQDEGEPIRGVGIWPNAARTLRRSNDQLRARWVTLPGDDRQHTSGGNCPCQPVQADNGAWDHR